MQNEELRRTQDVLEKSQRKFADLYDTAPVGHFTLDPGWHVLDINLTGCRMLEDERSNIVNRPFIRFVMLEDRHLFHQLLQNVYSKGLPDARELRLLKNSGTMFWAAVESVPAPDGRGQTVGVRTAISDVTTRKNLEAEKARLLRAIEETADGVVTILPDGTIDYVNPAFCRISGYPLSELIKKKINTVHAQTGGNPPTDAWGFLPGEVSWSGPLSLERRDGSTVQVEAAIAPIKDKD